MNILLYNRNIKQNEFRYNNIQAGQDCNIYIPIKRGKNKTIARGFWQDKNIIYYDYIQSIARDKINLKEIEKLKRDYRQEAIFYKIKNIGYIYYKKNKIDILQDRKIIKINKNFRGLKNRIKNILNKYNGLTIYKLTNCYIIEIFY